MKLYRFFIRAYFYLDSDYMKASRSALPDPMHRVGTYEATIRANSDPAELPLSLRLSSDLRCVPQA